MTRRRWRAPVALAAAALAAAAFVHGSAQEALIPGPTPAAAEATTVDVSSARTQLASLPTAGRAPMTGYAREQFGPAWADADRNGCDTRNDVLNRDLVDVEHKPGTHDCVVLSGTLLDPYTGDVIAFQRGESTSAHVQVDHVVALADAWQKGAQSWDPKTREQFANDPDNLLAVDGPTNAAKGAGDAATWLPPARSYRCQYVAAQVNVKATYGLAVTAAERQAIERVLDQC